MTTRNPEPVLATGLMAPGIPFTRVRPVKIAGIGSYAPEMILTNKDLEARMETSDEWIRSRTGIAQRHVAADDEASSDLAYRASVKALAAAHVSPDEVDLIIVPTATPDMVFPSTASILQHRLGASHAGAFDLSAACTGFIYAVATGSSFVASGMYDTVLIAAAECFTRLVDWNDRGTCVLFGDGAGSVVLTSGDDTSHFLGFELGSDGSGADVLKVPCGGSRIPISEEAVAKRLQYVHMVGSEVYKFAVRIVVESSLSVMRKCGVTAAELDWFVPHQANIRIIDAAVKRLEIPAEKVVTNVDRYGNTSAASIPLALDDLQRDGRIQKGDLALMVGFGGGLSWASALVRW